MSLGGSGVSIGGGDGFLGHLGFLIRILGGFDLNIMGVAGQKIDLMSVVLSFFRHDIFQKAVPQKAAD